MDGYSLSENWIFLLGFICAFFGVLAIATAIHDFVARNRRKIRQYFKDNVRWFQ